MQKPAFTLIELIFTIVIIGVLAVVAVPKFTNLADNAKITAELSTASAVQTNLEAIHTEWITNRCEFNWNVDKDIGTSNALFDDNRGYPITLGSSDDTPFDYILKDVQGWTRNGTQYRGPASSAISARNPDAAGKPDGNDYWDYNATSGEFRLVDN
jgi:prepilin-type N-terminal cleavage/methylation domain-containing protein